MQISFLKMVSISILLLGLGACGSVAPRHHTHQTGPIDTSTVIQTARAQLGTDYKYGGESPDEGFDCSGLVYYSFLQAGVALPRTTFGQYKRTRAVSREQLARGDLIFFRISRSRISHVGIYLGKNRFIHAPSTGKSVAIARLDTPYWRKRYIRAGRIYPRREIAQN